MDLKMTDVLYYGSCVSSSPNCSNNYKLGDISLSLNSLNSLNTHGMNERPAQTWSKETSVSEDDDCALFLGLGPTPNSYNKNSELGELPAIVGQGLSNHVDSGMLQLGLFRGENANPIMSMDQTHHSSSSIESHMYPSGGNLFVSAIDDGSTSAKTSLGGYMPSLILAPVQDNSSGKKSNVSEKKDHQHQFQFSSELSATTDCSVGTVSNPKNDCDSLSHHFQPKNCRFKGCTKGARGATRLCIGHGGGQRCQKLGCGKGAESRTAFCKAHGGGRRCQHLGCTKSAEGKTDFCIGHGGGRRCGHEGCTKAARGKSGLCIRHGGGKRCTVEGCSRSAEGRRCDSKWQDKIHSITHILTSPTTNPSLYSQLFISTHNPDPSIRRSAYPPLFSPPHVLFQWSITHLFFPRLLTRGLPHSSWRSKCPLQQPPPLVLSTGLDPAPERWGVEERKALFRKRLNRPPLGTRVPPLLGIFMPNLFIFTLLLWDPLSLRQRKNAPPFL